ncbi:hypothetical protein BCR34DRAFT_565669 [Clohesyomyces aquaticus]|uniref:Uncharacterized protein n=1 Tax=Clohesyomyces aquaticus TaxID=1231657 RepID=A0A1Y1ZLH6_9PLEO|nr:hypothetical protein BCR34DRAFT_565669 [Clohesyomyces aquaticus]
MASQMEWSPDFCLSCDRQIAEGTYCSQACRLADLEKAGNNEPTTPSALSCSASSSGSSHGFYLPPALNFSALKTPSTSRGFDMGAPSPPQQYYSTGHGYPYFHSTASQSTVTASQSQQRSLTPSSSRSSLASAASQSSSGISVQAANQLNGYVRSFDPVRDMKRRYTHY